MTKIFKQYPAKDVSEAFANTERIAKYCRVRIPEWESRTWHVPQIKGVSDPQATLEKAVRKALKRRKLGPEYTERVDHELAVIEQVGVAAFLLVAADVVRWARKQGIPTGSGRGSVGGSVAAWLIGLHRVDPIRHGLRFDRFLNPERPQMPDIDTDFGKARRDEVYEYIRETYGEGNVMNIATFQRMKTKRAFRALAKSHGISYEESNKISKQLSDDEDEDVEDELPKEMVESYPGLAQQVEAIRGLRCGYGAHPAGVVIAPPDFELTTRVPMMWLASSKRWVAQYDLHAFDDMGLLKLDILGLRTLDTIDECVRMVSARSGEGPQPRRWDPDSMDFDSEIYEMLTKGLTAGVFQFAGHANTQGITQIRPECFDDLVQCLALFRKGPMDAGLTDGYLEARRTGTISYLHPKLQPILEPTHGALIFQEQVLQVAEEIAGWGPGDSADLLKATAKKVAALMAEVGPKFVESCLANGIPEETTDKLWNILEKGSGYLFNKAHSAEYSRLAYETAGLKVQHPLEFYCALLRTQDDKEKRQAILSEAARSGLRILAPDINASGALAAPDYDKGGIRFGLSDVAGVGVKAAAKVLSYRGPGYATVEQVTDAVNNVRVLECLRLAGALRSVGQPWDADRAEELLGWAMVDQMKPWRALIGDSYSPPFMVYGRLIATSKAKASNGKTYCTWTVRWRPGEEWKIRLWSGASAVFKTPVGSIVRVAGRWQPDWRSISVNDSSEVKILESA